MTWITPLPAGRNNGHIHWRPTLAGLIIATAATAPIAADYPPASLPEEPSGVVYLTDGNWGGSGLSGHAPDAPTYWTSATGAHAIWKPGFTGPVRARVHFHRVLHPSTANPHAPVTVYYGVERETTVLDYTQGSSGWVVLGEFDFEGHPREGVLLQHVPESSGITRASAVRFDVLTDSDPPSVIQSILIDDVTHGPLAEENDWEPVYKTFDDIDGHDLQVTIERLATRGHIHGVDDGSFAPSSPLLSGDWAVWLHRAYQRIRDPTPWPGHRQPAEEEVAAAIEFLESLLGDTPLPETVTHRLASRTLNFAREESGRLTLDVPGNAVGFVPYGEGDPLTRAEGAEALWHFVQTAVEAGPPLHTDWDVTFREEFQGTELDLGTWAVESGSPGHILSSRWPENVEVRNGTLHLLTRKEERGGRSWTTGNIWTRHFRQQYGYFEARMKIGAATGLNNAFWLMTWQGQDPDYHFEIDVTEAHYPNRSLMTVHNWFGEHAASGQSHYSPENLSEDFHVYGLEWNETTITWYFDGRPVRTVEHDYCRAPSPVRLSSAVGRFAGRITDDLDGTEQVVDWVRVYQYPK